MMHMSEPTIICDSEGVVLASRSIQSYREEWNRVKNRVDNFWQQAFDSVNKPFFVSKSKEIQKSLESQSTENSLRNRLPLFFSEACLNEMAMQETVKNRLVESENVGLHLIDSQFAMLALVYREKIWQPELRTVVEGADRKVITGKNFWDVVMPKYQSSQDDSYADAILRARKYEDILVMTLMPELDQEAQKMWSIVVEELRTRKSNLHEEDWHKIVKEALQVDIPEDPNLERTYGQLSSEEQTALKIMAVVGLMKFGIPNKAKKELEATSLD